MNACDVLSKVCDEGEICFAGCCPVDGLTPEQCLLCLQALPLDHSARTLAANEGIPFVGAEIEVCMSDGVRSEPLSCFETSICCMRRLDVEGFRVKINDPFPEEFEAEEDYLIFEPGTGQWLYQPTMSGRRTLSVAVLCAIE